MNAYRWWEIGAVAAYALMLLFVANGPEPDNDEYDPEDCQVLGALDDYHRRPPPEWEVCPLTLDEEEAFEQITRGAGR